MKLSNEKIVNGTQALSMISQKQLPIKVSYAIAKNINKLQSELKIYNDEKQKLIDKYSIKDEVGKTIIDENNQIKIQEDKVQEWNKDMKDLLSIENEIDIFRFSMNEFNNKSYDISPEELINIDYMIEE